MAIGDVKSGLATLLQNESYAIQPPVGEEWVIHNIYYTQSVTLRIISGGQVLTFDSDTGQGARLGMSYHVTNGQFLQILSTYNGSQNVAFDGIQTK